MIEALRGAVRRRWPRLRLRTILLATLLFVAALPGVGALFLRVYENTLVRQTEAELVAQAAALAAAAATLWPDAPVPVPAGEMRPELSRIDLSQTPILPPRPDPVPADGPPDAAAEAAAMRLAPILAGTRQTTLAAILLLDSAGRIAEGAERGLSHAELPEVRAALAGEPETVLRRNGNYRQVYRFEWLTRAAAIRVHHARPVMVEGKVVGVLLLSRSARALFRGLYEDRGKIAFGVAAIAATLVMLSGLLSRGIARPIEALSAATREVAQGRGDVPDVPPTAAVEIQALYADFAEMARAIELRSRYLRDFAHAVSHEFKTPLAGITGAVELLQDHAAGMTAAERARFLGNIAADAARLNRLVTRLLELARADMARGGLEGEQSDLAPALARVADAFAGDRFRVALAVPGDLPPAAVPAAAIETALSALLENSRQAGAAQTEIRAWPEEGTLVVAVADDGPGIPVADRPRIFEPFFTTRRTTGGTGLGLPIAASLLQAYRASIGLRADGPGACFEIRLPVRASRT